MTRDITKDHNYDQLFEAIHTGQIKIVSDGSFQPSIQLGTSAWIIEFGPNQQQNTGCNIIPGSAKDQYS